MTEPNGIEAWREVHSKLLVACELAQEAVDVQLSQQRYWLEEIVGNVTEHGTLEITSHWAHPSAYRRTISKRKRNSLKKRRRTISEATFMRGKKRKFKLLKAVGRDSVSSSKGESESASVTSSHAEAPPRKLRIKMKRPSQPKPPPPPPPPPAPCQYEEPESADEEEEPEHHESTHNLAARDYVEAQQYVGQNPLQMMAAVAFGSSPAYASSGGMPEAPASSYTIPHPTPQLAYNPQSVRSSGLPTYGSLQDVQDEEDDRDNDDQTPF